MKINSIFRKWTKSILTSLLILTIVGSAGVITASLSSKTSQKIADETLPSLSTIAQSIQYRGETFLHLMLAINSKDNNEFIELENQVNTLSDLAGKELEKFEKTLKNDHSSELYHIMIEERDEYINLRLKILELKRNKNTDLANQLMSKELFPMYLRYVQSGHNLLEHTTNTGCERAKLISKTATISQILSIISSITIFIFGFLLGYTR